jgi:hypothetical protein
LASADGRCAISTSNDNTLKAWDLQTGEALATFTAGAPLRCCAYAGAQTVLAGYWSGNVHFLKLEEPE